MKKKAPCIIPMTVPQLVSRAVETKNIDPNIANAIKENYTLDLSNFEDVAWLQKVLTGPQAIASTLEAGFRESHKNVFLENIANKYLNIEGSYQDRLFTKDAAAIVKSVNKLLSAEQFKVALPDSKVRKDISGYEARDFVGGGHTDVDFTFINGTDEIINYILSQRYKRSSDSLEETLYNSKNLFMIDLAKKIASDTTLTNKGGLFYNHFLMHKAIEINKLLDFMKKTNPGLTDKSKSFKDRKKILEKQLDDLFTSNNLNRNFSFENPEDNLGFLKKVVLTTMQELKLVNPVKYHKMLDGSTNFGKQGVDKRIKELQKNTTFESGTYERYIENLNTQIEDTKHSLRKLIEEKNNVVLGKHTIEQRQQLDTKIENTKKALAKQEQEYNQKTSSTFTKQIDADRQELSSLLKERDETRLSTRTIENNQRLLASEYITLEDVLNYTFASVFKGDFRNEVADFLLQRRVMRDLLKDNAPQDSTFYGRYSATLGSRMRIGDMGAINPSVFRNWLTKRKNRSFVLSNIKLYEKLAKQKTSSLNDKERKFLTKFVNKKDEIHFNYQESILEDILNPQLRESYLDLKAKVDKMKTNKGVSKNDLKKAIEELEELEAKASIQNKIANLYALKRFEDSNLLDNVRQVFGDLNREIDKVEDTYNKSLSKAKDQNTQVNREKLTELAFSQREKDFDNLIKKNKNKLAALKHFGRYVDLDTLTNSAKLEKDLEFHLVAEVSRKLLSEHKRLSLNSSAAISDILSKEIEEQIKYLNVQAATEKSLKHVKEQLKKKAIARAQRKRDIQNSIFSSQVDISSSIGKVLKDLKEALETDHKNLASFSKTPSKERGLIDPNNSVNLPTYKDKVTKTLGHLVTLKESLSHKFLSRGFGEQIEGLLNNEINKLTKTLNRLKNPNTIGNSFNVFSEIHALNLRINKIDRGINLALTNIDNFNKLDLNYTNELKHFYSIDKDGKAVLLEKELKAEKIVSALSEKYKITHEEVRNFLDSAIWSKNILNVAGHKEGDFYTHFFTGMYHNLLNNKQSGESFLSSVFGLLPYHIRYKPLINASSLKFNNGNPMFYAIDANTRKMITIQDDGKLKPFGFRNIQDMRLFINNVNSLRNRDLINNKNQLSASVNLKTKFFQIHISKGNESNILLEEADTVKIIYTPDHKIRAELRDNKAAGIISNEAAGVERDRRGLQVLQAKLVNELGWVKQVDSSTNTIIFTKPDHKNARSIPPNMGTAEKRLLIVPDLKVNVKTGEMIAKPKWEYRYMATDEEQYGGWGITQENIDNLTELENLTSKYINPKKIKWIYDNKGNAFGKGERLSKDTHGPVVFKKNDAGEDEIHFRVSSQDQSRLDKVTQNLTPPEVRPYTTNKIPTNIKILQEDGTEVLKTVLVDGPPDAAQKAVVTGMSTGRTVEFSNLNAKKLPIVNRKLETTIRNMFGTFVNIRS